MASYDDPSALRRLIRTVAVVESSRLTANDRSSLHGVGLKRLAAFMSSAPHTEHHDFALCKPAADQGRLVRPLHRWAADPSEIPWLRVAAGR